MWSIENHDDVAKRLKKFKKRWSHEMKNVFDNLDTLHEALCCGTRPEQLKNLGFVHSEPNGVLAIDQKGPGKGSRMKQFRMYVFPDEDEQVLYVRTIGDKSTQEEDLKIATAFAREIIDKKRDQPGGEAKDAEVG